MADQKTKEQLLAELKELGVNGGRKPRADAGKPRPGYTRSDKPRTDKGVKRQQYVKTPSYFKNLFQTFVENNQSEFGDSLIRDDNLIFPSEVTSYYKKITRPDGTTYRSSVVRSTHPEKLRWNWFFSEREYAKRDADIWHWEKQISNWYFIKEEELVAWTYMEWSWAYYTQIAGHFNRHKDQSNIVLSYEDYLNGKYGFPDVDDNGNIVWTRR